MGLFRRKLTLRRLLYVTRIAGVSIVCLVVVTGIVELVDYLAAR